MRIEDFAITLGWAIIVASIILQAMYKPRYALTIVSPLSLTILDYFGLLAASVLAGIILSDAQKVLLGYIASLFMSVLIMFLALISPAFLGTVKYVSAGGLSLLYGGAIVLIFQHVFPYAMFVIFLGGVLGGILGERLNL